MPAVTAAGCVSFTKILVIDITAKQTRNKYNKSRKYYNYRKELFERCMCLC